MNNLINVIDTLEEKLKGNMELLELVNDIRFESEQLIEAHETEAEFGNGLFKYLLETKQIDQAKEFCLNVDTKGINNKYKNEVEKLTKQGFIIPNRLKYGHYNSGMTMQFAFMDKEFEHLT